MLHCIAGQVVPRVLKDHIVCVFTDKQYKQDCHAGKWHVYGGCGYRVVTEVPGKMGPAYLTVQLPPPTAIRKFQLLWFSKYFCFGKVFFTSVAAWIVYPVCSCLQIHKGSAGFFFERETCNSVMAARSEGTVRCVSRYCRGERCFLSLWSTSHYLSYPNVIPISWSKWVKSTLKETSCFLLVPWAASESAFRFYEITNRCSSMQSILFHC